MTVNAQFLRNLQQFRLVTFDVTDTLLCLKDPIIQYTATAAEYGVNNLDKQRMKMCFRQEFKRMDKAHPNFGRHTQDMSWQQWWHQLVCNVFQCVDDKLTGKQIDKIAQKLLCIYRTQECWTHVDSGVEFVETLRNADKFVGVISNFDPSLSTVLSEMGLIDKFDFVLTSYKAGFAKPDAKIFGIPLEKLGLKSSQALHIGNKYDIDYIGAKRSGWSSLLVQDPGSHLDNVDETHVYASLADMLDALKTKNINW